MDRYELIDMLAYEIPRRNWLAGLSRLGVDKEAQKAIIRRANQKRRRQVRMRRNLPENDLYTGGGYV